MSEDVGPGAVIAGEPPDAGAAGSRPGPLKQVRLLLPVWGEAFIIQFVNISLPTLLAPGNIPAVAAVLPCTFIFLTNTEGAETLRDHPGVECIRKYCDVEFDIIDDLITGDNYSTTLTLGYARAIRAVGQAMLDTCFMFLISDYIVADGSLSRVLDRVRSGYSGVLAGNFQVVEEDAKSSLLQMYETGVPDVALSARKLISWALDFLHPMTLANTINFSFYHSTHSNRLFWRVDQNTLIGRFYLMHMIAIRPEVTDFEIGASCDYSFIPEMCPSGNVHVVSESDEYVVVELQRRAHEADFIRLGASDLSDLVDSLSEWTTERHRMNAHTAVVYRAADLSPTLLSVIEESRSFVDNIEAELPKPKPFRDHPYWVGAIASHRRVVLSRRKAENPKVRVDDDSEPRSLDFRVALYGLRNLLFGRPTRLRPWHPRWPDYKMLQNLAQKFLVRDVPGKTLILSSSPADFRGLLQGPDRSDESLGFKQFQESDAAQYEQFVGKYDGCLLVIRDVELNLTSELLQRIRPLLSVNDYVIVFITNGQGLGIGEQFNHRILQAAGRFFDRRIRLEAVEFVSAGRIAWAALRSSRSMFGQSVQNPIALVICAIPMAAMLAFTIIGNALRSRAQARPSGGLCSSVGVVMRVMEKSTERPEPIYSSELRLSRLRFLPRVPQGLRSSNVETRR